MLPLQKSIVTIWFLLQTLLETREMRLQLPYHQVLHLLKNTKHSAIDDYYKLKHRSQPSQQEDLGERTGTRVSLNLDRATNRLLSGSL